MKKIALIAPSSPADFLTPETICQIKERFESVGFQIHLCSHALDSVRYLAGTDDHRAQDVMSAFQDEFDAVMTVRGGYGSPRILDKIDYADLKQKPFMTISDGTALQTALWTKAGISGYSGFQAGFLLNPKNEALFQQTIKVLSGEKMTIPLSQVDREGQTTGMMLGGNLVVFESLIGTSYFPDMTDKILVIEEVNEEPYKVDRMLAHLKLAGIFQKIKGLVIGDFSSCLAKDPADGTIENVFYDYFKDLNIPVARISYGHRNRQTIVPIGKKVKLDTRHKILKEL